jgi:hypothetical protein
MLNGIDKIEGLTPEQIEAINGLGKGLVDKNADLLTKLAAGKEAGTASEAELERLRLLESNLEQAKLEEKENYQGALTLKEQEYSKALEKLNSQGESDRSLIHKLLVENGLSAELIKLNVSPDLLPMVQAALSAQATVSEGKAMIGEQSLSDFCKEWSETPAGKAACMARNNSGGDASGGSGGAVGKKWSDFNAAQLSQLLREDPQAYDQLKQTR